MRANLLLATIKGPPPRGSMQEAVLQALLIKKDQAEYAKTRAIIQSVINEKEAQSALEEYRNILFPYFETIQGRDKKMYIDQLMKETSGTALKVVPIEQAKVRSRVRKISRDRA